jgi:quinol monooxygenase YgiN
MESHAPRPIAPAHDAHDAQQEVALNAATASFASPGIGAPSVTDDALIKPLDNPYNVAVPAGPMPMFGAFLLQRTTNFDGWRAAFEQSRAQRQQAGFVAQGIMRGIDDPQQVAVWLAVTDVAQAKRYFADKTVRAQLKAAGAVGPFEVQLSSNIAAKVEPGRTGLSAAILRLRLDEPEMFKSAFAAAEREREQAGIVGYSLGQDVDDQSLISVYLQSEDPALLREYVASKHTKQIWLDAGLRGQARLTLVKEGELTLCR